MLHKTGIFLAQVLAYPQKSRCARFVPAGVTAPTGFGAQGLHPRKCLWRKGKRVVHTQGPALLLRLCFYKDIKEEDRRTTGNPQRRPMRYAGQALAMEKDRKPRRWQPGVGFWWGARAFKGRQAAHNALDDINGWGWRCNGAVRARPLGGAGGGAGQVARAHRRQKLWARGKTGTGCRQHASAPQGLREEGFEVCHRQRFAEQVALVQVATGLAQRNALLFGFTLRRSRPAPGCARAR